MPCWRQGLGDQLLGNCVEDVSLLKRLQETEIVTCTFRDFELEHALSNLLQTATMYSPTTAIIPFMWSEAERHALGAAASGSEARADAGSRRLHALVRGFGGCAAPHRQGTATAHPLCALLPRTPWGVVTVPALVRWARW